jgi:hypothetical protein
MDEKPDQIEEHINRTRGNLDSNIHELEDKVRSAFNWRTQFEERPMVMLGAAMAGGMLAAAIIPRVGRRRRRSGYNFRYAPQKEYRSGSERWAGSRASERERERENGKDRHDALEALKGAVITGVAAKVGSILGELVNHYKEQLMTGGRHRESRYSESEAGSRTYDRERTARPH